MRPQDIKVGESYNHHTSPKDYFAKVVRILKPGQYPNKQTYTIVECEWTHFKDDSFAITKFFRPCDLEKEGTR